jgi:hypothetical protein
MADGGSCDSTTPNESNALAHAQSTGKKNEHVWNSLRDLMTDVKEELKAFLGWREKGVDRLTSGWSSEGSLERSCS